MKQAMPDSFASGMKAVLDAAQDEAKRLSYGYVGSEHLLLGLIREADGLVAEVLASLAIGLEGARAQVLQVTGRGIQPAEPGGIPLTPLAGQVLDLAARQARRFHAPGVGQEHLLQALIMELRGEAVRVLTRLGNRPAAIRDRYVQLAGLGKSAARSIRVPQGPVFEQLTDGYRKVVSRAYAEAWMLHHDRIGTGHLLLALAGVDGEPAAEALKSAGVSLDAARRCVSEQGARPSAGRLAPGQEPAGLAGYAEDAKKALGSAALEALRRGDRHIGTEHMLVGLLDQDNTAFRVLAQLGCTPAGIRDRLRR